MVDGKEIPGKLLPARKRGGCIGGGAQVAGPACWNGWGAGCSRRACFRFRGGGAKGDVGLFAAVQAGAGSDRFFCIRCRLRSYTSQPIEMKTLRVALESSTPITKRVQPDATVDIQKSDDKHATITYSATAVVPSKRFPVFYDVDGGNWGRGYWSYGRQGGGWVFLDAGGAAVADQAGAVAENGGVRGRSLGDMTGKRSRRLKGRLRLCCRICTRGPVQHCGVRQPDSRPSSRNCRSSTRRRERPPWVLPKGCSPGKHEIDGALTLALAQLADSARPNTCCSDRWSADRGGAERSQDRGAQSANE